LFRISGTKAKWRKRITANAITTIAMIKVTASTEATIKASRMVEAIATISALTSCSAVSLDV
jgi:hypothetical protein